MEISITMNSENVYAEIFGPYFLAWCQRLHSLAEMYGSQGKTKLYFSTRAGYVLYKFFSSYVKQRNINQTYQCELFPISRLAAIKAGFGEEPMWTGHLCNSVFYGKTLNYLITRLGRDSEYFDVSTYLQLVPKKLQEKIITPGVIKEWFEIDEALPIEQQISSYFKQQKMKLDCIIDSGDDINVIIVDSGLYGLTVELLAGLYPHKNVIGAFVYLSNYNKVRPVTHLDKCYGLMGEAQKANYKHPHTCVLRHWHLIEELLEPSGIPSLTEYTDKVMIREYVSDDSRINSIIDFITSGEQKNLSSILNRLNYFLANPSIAVVRCLSPKRRKNDVNDESMHVIILHDLEVKLRERDKLRRFRYGIIKRSLWREGQYTQSYGFIGRAVNVFKLLREIVLP